MIIGLTDRPAAPPQIGVLRKGAPKNGNKPGEDLKYFRFDCSDKEAVERFQEIYGVEPRAIHVFVPFPTTTENFEAWREEWIASGLKHRCDGQTMSLWQTPRGTYSKDPQPCPYADRADKDRPCKPVGRLKVMIPELKRFALVAVLTTSIHDIMELYSNLQAIQSIQNLRGGTLQGVPMILKRTPRKISTPGDDGKRARRDKWLLSIEAQPQWVELQLAAAEQAALPQAEPLALPEWEGDDDDDPVEEPCNTDPVDNLVTPDTLKAIQHLWATYGNKQGNKITPLADYLHHKKQIDKPSLMTQEYAVKVLEWLQQKALAVGTGSTNYERRLDEQSDELLSNDQQTDQGSGLDQWRCTRESQSRHTAMEVLNATRRLEAAGVTEEQWRAELNALFESKYAPPVSRKSLSPDECREWLGLVNQWAGKREAKQ